LVFAFAQTAAASGSDNVFITTEGVNLRNAPSTDGGIITSVAQGTEITILNHDPAGWSRVRRNGTEGYIRSDFLTFPSRNAPATFRTTAGVNMRAAPNTDAEVLRVINVGTEVEVTAHDPTGWSNVRLNDTSGFIRSDLLMFPTTTTGTQQTASTPAAAQPIETLQTVGGVNLRQSPSTDARIVRVLNPGTRVDILSNGSNGWSNVRVNGDAGYIRTDLLGSGPRTVELLTWEQARRLIPTGVDIPITDVRTGRTFNVRAFSIGRHADVDTSTQRDTDIKFDIRGGTWSWAARPVWVHLNGRTLAASINGMPHAGSAVSGNGLSGHFCLHFAGTVTNNQGYQTSLRNAVQEAYNAGRR